MKLIKKVLIYWVLSVVMLINFLTISPALAKDSDLAKTYQGAISETIGDHTDLTAEAVDWVWWEVFNKQVVTLIWYAIDVFIAIWVAVALIWAYKIMVSNKEA